MDAICLFLQSFFFFFFFKTMALSAYDKLQDYYND